MKKDEKKDVVKQSPKPLKGETMFEREEIMRQPSAFGVNHFMLIGAMAEMNDEKYSRSQVLDAVKLFKERKVEQK